MSTEFRIDEAVQILQRTPAVLEAMLSGQPAAWLEYRDDQKSFSALDVLGHLIHGEMTDWIPRARIILECGTSRAFDPFDLKGMHPELGVVTMRQLLATWTVHDLGHLAQISRTMARRYREDVGPWRAYIS